jgi:hypothetical protein
MQIIYKYMCTTSPVSKSKENFVLMNGQHHVNVCRNEIKCMFERERERIVERDQFPEQGKR